MVRVQEQEQGREKRQRVAEVIGARIEPITRFKGTELKELSPDQASSAELVVTTRQRVELDLETATQPGRLPEGVVARPDLATAEAAWQQRLATAESDTATRIQQWAGEEPGRYRRLLPRSAGLGGQHGDAIGTEWPCPACGQRGHRPCNGCVGSGQQPCPDCEGRGRQTCRQCRGLGRRACGACDGRGLVRAPPPAAPETRVACAACSQGWLHCNTCDGLGEQSCTRCTATGGIVCPDCEGRKTLDCLDCRTTGWQHRLGWVRERIDTEDRLEVHHPDPVVAEAVAARFQDVTTLGTCCTIEQVRYTTAPLAVQAVQRLRLPVYQARLQVAGHAMAFTALGPALDILDHQHVAAVLLAHDLTTLEKNAAGTGRHLVDALQRFLQSPLNREIAARMPPAEIARQYPGMVDEAYVGRAVQATQQAVERLWLQHVRQPRLLCLVGVGLVAALSVALGSPRLGLWSGAALGLGAGLAGWIAADWQTRRRLAQTLQIPHGDRLLRPLRRSGTVRRWQTVSLAAAALVALAGAGAATRLPHVRQHTQQTRATAALAQQLQTWLVNDGKDYRLRRYPAADALVQAVGQTEADPRARVVRAWQLLTGADGIATDAHTAERLLDGLERRTGDPPVGSAAVIGQARATLALRPRSLTALQNAAAALDALPAPPPPEALYTLALLQLAPTYATPLGGPQTGLATLQQAADLGHASACFALGRRLASGNGLRRDPVAARRYLHYAEAKGVPGAAQALGALR